MVELGMQCALLLLCSLASSDIDVNSHHPLRMTILKV
jgi:hypothetical protein